ncbi:MAG TPA: DNA repair protein RecN [Alphaproteobacteria bacterium]|nr:DNA repair protein RecN [Alphaproteobacteria bacterium]
MLAGLSIRDIVLIERLALNFAPGLTVLTGETGAGKSILLDALALALGERADSGLVRHGAPQAAVTAEFDLPPGHPALAILDEQDIPAESPLVIRRTLTADGRSRGFVNDQPVSVGLLKRLAETLVEIHGQFETHGLFDPGTHRLMLDLYGGLEDRAGAVAEAWRGWRAAEAERAQAVSEAETAKAEEAYLREVVTELETLAPKPGEEASLSDLKQRLQNREKLLDALSAAQRDLAGDRGAELLLSQARRALERVADRAGGSFDSIVAALDRAQIEIGEALGALEAAAAEFDAADQDLGTVDDRLFDLRRVARRHGVAVDDLAALSETLARRLAGLEDGDGHIAALTRRAAECKAAYVAAAEALTAARRKTAGRLDAAVMAELKPLKLERARFMTEIAPLNESEWGENGADRIAFAVSTNPGQPPGPLAKIASGGELARFMLALKVVLAGASSVPVLVFDEVDSGVGGATADAVGERLARLAETRQILVVTHSPQVAARGAQHWQVRKALKAGAMATEVVTLDKADRQEEIARMLSGAEVTAEARAAAGRLIERPATGELL